VIPRVTRKQESTACYNLCGHTCVRLRILVSMAIGVATGVLCWHILDHFHQGAADFAWARWGAQALLARQNPYDAPMQLYPLTAIFFGFPFVWLTPAVAGGAFYGASSALLAFGLTRHGWHCLLVFLAYPYWAGMLTAQWSPLIMAGALFPLLLPVSMAKPQIGLPVFLTHLSRRGVLACVVFGLISLAVMPAWPRLWIAHFGSYEHFIPLLVLPGPLLALAAFRYRDRDAMLLLTMAIMPQRWFYDLLVLWLIPKSRRELLITVFFSWGAGIWRWYHVPHSYTEVARWAIGCIYLPMLGVILVRWWRDRNLARAPHEAVNQSPAVNSGPFHGFAGSRREGMQ
jgi:hypothetical protein